MRLIHAISTLEDSPHPDGVVKHALVDGTNVYSVTVVDLIHGVIYEITENPADPIVTVLNVIDGNVYRLGFPQGDPRSH